MANVDVMGATETTLVLTNDIHFHFKQAPIVREIVISATLQDQEGLILQILYLLLRRIALGHSTISRRKT